MLNIKLGDFVVGKTQDCCRFDPLTKLFILRKSDEIRIDMTLPGSNENTQQ